MIYFSTYEKIRGGKLLEKKHGIIEAGNSKEAASKAMKISKGDFWPPIQNKDDRIIEKKDYFQFCISEPYNQDCDIIKVSYLDQMMTVWEAE